jgi:hypothetical protein
MCGTLQASSFMQASWFKRSSAKFINRRRLLLHRRTPRRNTREEMSRFWLRGMAGISPDQRKCNTQQIYVYTASPGVTRSPESLPSDPKFISVAQKTQS